MRCLHERTDKPQLVVHDTNKQAKKSRTGTSYGKYEYIKYESRFTLGEKSENKFANIE